MKFAKVKDEMKTKKLYRYEIKSTKKNWFGKPKFKVYFFVFDEENKSDIFFRNDRNQWHFVSCLSPSIGIYIKKEIICYIYQCEQI